MEGGIKMKDNVVIAIDGYSSCGKSTVAKALAKKLNYIFIDSGAMYRAVTWYILKNNIQLDDEKSLANALANIQIDFVPNSATNKLLLNGEDITEAIRTMEVSEFVSEVSAVKIVRDVLVQQQQNLGKKRSIVMDGRDIGTTVFPNADLKIFMTANPQIRAERRYAELTAKGELISMEQVKENLAHRDHIDSTRKESPLRQAQDAIVLDNSELNQEQQLDIVIDLVNERLATQL